MWSQIKRLKHIVVPNHRRLSIAPGEKFERRARPWATTGKQVSMLSRLQRPPHKLVVSLVGSSDDNQLNIIVVGWCRL